MTTSPVDIQRRLGAPFHPLDLKFKPQTVTDRGPKAMLVGFVNARAIADRLDEVVGADGWEDSYTLFGRDERYVLCRLSVTIGGRTVHKQGLGEAADIGGLKAAESDALKRAATKFGIGRYLYYLPQRWVQIQEGYPPRDNPFALRVEDKRRGIKGWCPYPDLPPWALPGGNGRPSTRDLGPRPSTADVYEHAQPQEQERPAQKPDVDGERLPVGGRPTKHEDLPKWSGGMTSMQIAARMLAAFRPHTDHKVQLGDLMDWIADPEGLARTMGLPDGKTPPRPSRMDERQLGWLLGCFDAPADAGMPRAMAGYLAHCAKG